jgi:para-nitrobenzyl esterase
MRANRRCRKSKLKFTAGFLFGMLIVFAACTSLTPVALAAGDPVIHTESGRLQGIVGTQEIEYLGIPYAAPPVGPLRWMPPQPFGRWEGIFQATTFGSECEQLNQSGVPAGSEDCLFLNVYTPLGEHRVKPRGRAVMVWVHGGGLQTGAGSDFDPTPLVTGGDVIVVTINYRLGMLGFFAQTALDSEGHLAANYGLMDQQFALAWVQRNIENFGGDPDRVTLFGESAGGLSVYSQIASPLAAGLFHRAISQSGAFAGFSPDYRVDIIPIATAETVGGPSVPSGIALSDAFGCASQTAACLRAVDPATIVLNQPKPFPVIDGTLLTETPGDAFNSGDFNRVPVMTGNNHDEFRYFVASDFTLPVTNAQYSSVFTTVFGAVLAPSVEPEYPLPASPPANDTELQLAAAGTDGLFVCSARRAERGLVQYVTVYAYEFSDENAPPPATPFPGLDFPLGAYHSADVQFLLNRIGPPPPDFTPDEVLLSQAMISYWTHFAKKADPNSKGQPHWRPYNSLIDERQSFVPPTPVVESGSTFDTFHMCSSYWDTL